MPVVVHAATGYLSLGEPSVIDISRPLSIPRGGSSSLRGIMSDLLKLSKRVRAATGHDVDLDRSIADLLDHDVTKIPEYTGSVDACIDLVHRVLPGWSWHIGYGPRGVIPYAALSHDQARYEAKAPTVPLALLVAVLEAKIGGREGLSD